MKITVFFNKGVPNNLASFLVMIVFGMLFLFFPNYSLATPNTDTMLGYWKFDGNLTDLSGHGNAGIFSYGAASLAEFPITSFPNTGSATFPSLTSRVDIASVNNLSPTGALTFSMWLRLDQIPAGANQIIAGNYLEADINQGFNFSINNSSLYFHLGNSAVTFPLDGNVTANNWFHVTGTWDHSIMRLYLNGVEINSLSHTVAPIYTGTSFALGNFLGEMDDVRLYSRALTPLEIADLADGNHTSAIWDGSSDINYENIQNWNTEVIPDPYTIIGIPDVTNEPEFSQSEAVAGIKILNNASLNIHDYNLQINDSGVLDNSGSFIFENTDTQVISGFVNDLNSGTIVVAGTSAGTALKTGSQYFNLTINGTGSVSSPPATLVVNGDLSCSDGIFVLQENTVVHGNIILNGGSLSASSASPINLYGNWSSNSTTSFDAGVNSSINLIGANQSIAGSNTFYNLTKNSTTASTLTFDSASLQTIQGALYLNGAINNRLSLRSTTTGTRWRINPLGTVSISYLDIMDSNNIGTPINVVGNNFVNSGNNLNWIFEAVGPQINPNYIEPSTSNPRYPITGSVADDSIISEAIFRIDTDMTEFPCTPDDGFFDETVEAFTCTPNSNLSDGVHTFYISISDIYNNTTSTAVDISIDTVAPTMTTFSIPETSNSLTVSVTTFVASGANSYILTESATAPLTNNSNWNTTVQSSYTFSTAGVRTLYAWTKDTAGNVSSSLNDTVVIVLPDIIAPTIDSITVIPNANSVEIGWLTDENSSSKVEFGNTISYGETTNEQSLSAPVQNHLVLISGLSSCTSYHFRVISRDGALNQTLSPDQSFTTGGCVVVEDNSDSSSCDLDEPGEPDIISAQANDSNSITLEIDEASGDDDEYEIDYGTNSGSYQWNVDDLDKDDIDSFEISELSSGTTYYFRVRAKNKCEKGSWSDEVSEKTETEKKLIAESLQTPLINKIEPAKEVINNSTEKEEPRAYLFNEDNNKDIDENDDDKDQESSSNSESEVKKDAKKSQAPIREELGTSAVELMEDLSGGKKLKISGYGPPNTTLKVYVYSDDPIVLSVKTDKDGNWSYILENELEDGEHQVYVAVTENTGEIKGKSNPLVFIKTAQAVSVISNQGVSPMEKAKNNFFVYAVVISVAAIVLALLIIGWRFRPQKSDENFSDR